MQLAAFAPHLRPLSWQTLFAFRHLSFKAVGAGCQLGGSPGVSNPIDSGAAANNVIPFFLQRSLNPLLMSVMSWRLRCP